MRIKIKKRDVIVLSIVLLSIALIPLVYSVKTNFGITLQITNTGPVVRINNQSSFSVDPVTGSNAIVLISFNVTDTNGVGDINATTAVVNITLGYESGQWVENISNSGGELGACRNHTEGTIVVINCTVLMRYFNNASANWKINITVKDIGGSIGRNDSLFSLTYNTLSALGLPNKFLNFSTVTTGQQDVRAYPHLLLNNTGNDDFDMINITAAALVGISVTSESIAVTNFGANISNSSSNQRTAFPSDGVLTLTQPDANQNGDRNASLIHGDQSAFSPNRDKGNKSVFFWANIPSSGLSTQTFNATWNVTVINN